MASSGTPGGDVDDLTEHAAVHLSTVETVEQNFLARLARGRTQRLRKLNISSVTASQCFYRPKLAINLAQVLQQVRNDLLELRLSSGLVLLCHDNPALTATLRSLPKLVRIAMDDRRSDCDLAVKPIIPLPTSNERGALHVIRQMRDLRRIELSFTTGDVLQCLECFKDTLEDLILDYSNHPFTPNQGQMWPHVRYLELTSVALYRSAFIEAFPNVRHLKVVRPTGIVRRESEERQAQFNVKERDYWPNVVISEGNSTRIADRAAGSLIRHAIFDFTDESKDDFYRYRSSLTILARSILSLTTDGMVSGEHLDPIKKELPFLPCLCLSFRFDGSEQDVLDALCLLPNKLRLSRPQRHKLHLSYLSLIWDNLREDACCLFDSDDDKLQTYLQYLSRAVRGLKYVHLDDKQGEASWWKAPTELGKIEKLSAANGLVAFQTCADTEVDVQNIG